MKEELPPPDFLEVSKAKGHEVRDVNIPRTLLYGFGLLVLVVLAGAVLSAVTYKSMGWIAKQQPPPPQYQAKQSELPPAPRLEVQGRQDLKGFREAEQKQLDTYGWVAKERGIVRIPIERAMEIIADR